jgi:hypothetical protein
MIQPIIDAEIADVQPMPPGTTPNYDKENPVWRLVDAVEAAELAAGREHYVADSLHFLFPVRSMALYGPSGDAWETRDPRLQDNKNDFQKQNVRAFELAGTHLVRGWAHAGGWTGPFLRLSYLPGADSPLLGPGGVFPGERILLYLRVGNASTGSDLIEVPYNPVSHRYEVELWGADGGKLHGQLDPKGQAAMDRGELLARPDLVRGSLSDFQGPGFDELRDQATREGRAVETWDYVPDHAMHPVRPLHVEAAWATADREAWDSRGGANHHYEFSMSFRGWRHYLGVGHSSNPHGGVGSLEFRNLYSNYFGYEGRRRASLGPAWQPELGREVAPWSFDADGRKPPVDRLERFLAVDYMDLHILKPGCSIGIHRHRDNQEVFLLLQGKGLMVTGDWGQHPARARALEVRTMQPGDLAVIKGGQLHALVNPLDENVQLFMFGGYD